MTRDQKLRLKASRDLLLRAWLKLVETHGHEGPLCREIWAHCHPEEAQQEKDKKEKEIA